MVINGLQVVIQYPCKTKRFLRVAISKSKVGKRRVRLHTVTYEALVPDDQAFMFDNKILVSPTMFEKLKNEIKLQESQSMRRGFPYPNCY